MTTLSVLSLENCTLLPGKIPSEIGKLASLNALRLSHNSLTGSIPDSLGMLVQALVIALDHNQLTGTVPEVIADCVELTSLFLSDNKLTGPMPSFILEMGNLKYVSIENNYFTGTILNNSSSDSFIWADDDYGRHVAGTQQYYSSKKPSVIPTSAPSVSASDTVQIAVKQVI